MAPFLYALNHVAAVHR